MWYSYRVQVLPRPFGAVHLIVQLLGHDALGVKVVQMSQVHCKKRKHEDELDR